MNVVPFPGTSYTFFFCLQHDTPFLNSPQGNAFGRDAPLRLPSGRRFIMLSKKDNLEARQKECIKMKDTISQKTNAELLSTILGVSESVLNLYDLSAVLEAPRSIMGVGEAKAKKVYALSELTKRLINKTTRPFEVIHGPEDTAHYLMPLMRYESRERFVIVILNTKNHILAVPTISTGSLTASVVHPREVFSEALKYPTAAIILAHNHPSGDPTPSREDIAITRRLINVGKLMDIPVLDHIIIGDNRFKSLKEENII